MSEHMNEEERNTHFRKLADRFIDTANRQTEDTEPSVINSSFLYAASRFCAFVVASKAGEAERYDSLKAEALEYYTKEFNKMLSENLDNYAAVFDDTESQSH
jgi:hypothetical protein